MSEDQFEKLVLGENKAAKKLKPGEEKGYEHMNMWWVEFFVDWADTCIYVYFSGHITHFLDQANLG
jgi:hypothetical protein